MIMYNKHIKISKKENLYKIKMYVTKKKRNNYSRDSFFEWSHNNSQDKQT